MTATVNFDISGATKRNGKKNIQIRITKKRVHKRIKSGLEVKKENFNTKGSHGKWIRTSDLFHKKMNETLINILYKTKEKIREYEEKGLAHSAEAITKLLREEREQKEPNTFFKYANKHIEEFKTAGKFTTARAYETDMNVLKEFAGNKLKFEDINYEFLIEFEAHLREKRLNKINSIYRKMKHIRALFNKAIKNDRIVSREHYPFDQYKLKTEESEKEYLSVDELKELIHYNLKKDSPLWHARAIYLFSCFHGGIRIQDMLSMKWRNLKNNIIRYRSSKTGKVSESINLNSRSEEFIKHYKKEQIARTFIFPFLTNEDAIIELNDPDRFRTRIKGQSQKINNLLNELTSLIGINKHITNHTARHTFATLANNNSMPFTIIQQILKHSNPKTTQAYLRTLPSEKINKEVDNLWQGLNLAN